ncbi:MULTISPECIES: DUF6364 family protein [Pedobacter]|uniref:Uncharacterized protein n=1 Tax=Pedobacter psychrotolerans TaxID=1843235 RepID=A0A4V2S085_9SPHI|nr:MULTISPECIES: DUF6364 family protein [Pedobacter]TCO30656.1 hypothetical protein EV200_10189 [Pedobacter psychrotolerans]GGE68528.1 hypothetical protein GCM10011413_39000 [Pedobacter psychrotolerans]
MNTKLTLTIDESVIKRAKAYAEEQGRSLSAVVENYLKAVTKREEIEPIQDELSPILKSFKGAFKMPLDFDYKEELNKIRDEKYQRYLDNENK